MNRLEPCSSKPLETNDRTIKVPDAVLWVGLSFLRQYWQQFVTRLTHAQELHVWQRVDRTGWLYWQAYDPVTGQSTTGSEADIRAWIEHLHYSKR